MTKKIFILLFLISSVSFSYSQNANIETLTLDNGLTVILDIDQTQSKVFGAVVCKAGGKNDPEDATGMAHYQEHMLFKGSEDVGTLDWEKEKVHIDKIFELYDELGETTDETKRAEIQKKINEESIAANKYAVQNEFSNLTKSLGGTNLNAGTGWDMTIFYNAFPPNQLANWLELNSNRFEKPVFRGFQQELEVVYEEKNLYSDIFIFPLIEQFNKHFYKNHPYGQRTLIGSAEDLKNPSLTKMYEFFKTYYVPNNMALILSGNFKKEEAIELIKEKFGDWESKKLPSPKVYEEKEFNGREFVEAKLSPIKLAFLGYRTVPQGDKDENKLDIFHALLSNSNSTGLLDKLTIDSKIMAAQIIPMLNFDYGATVILVIPKIIGQSLEEAEELVLAEIEKIKSGDITDEQIEAIKNQLYIEKTLSLEDLESRTYNFATAFALGEDINEYLSGIEEIKSITKEEVIDIANKYFNDNYLAFYSKMGTAPKDKIEKPEYEAIIPNADVKSEYAQKIENAKIEDINPNFVNFSDDIKVAEIQKNVNLIYSENTENDIYTLKIKFGAGNLKIPLLKYATTILNVSGCEEYNVNDFKFEMSKLGTTYYFTSDDDYLYLELTGVENNLKEVLELVNKLINNPVADAGKIDLVIEAEKTSRKMEKSEPDNIADALLQKVMYNDKSSYLNRLTMKELENLTANQLIEEYKKVLNFETEIIYIGNPEIIDYENIKTLFVEKLNFNTDLELSSSPEYKEITKLNENTVYFVNKKNAAQSKIFVLINGNEYNIENQATIDAFNLYFGGDFSGLVLQEIREYRSMAYTAGAFYKTPNISGKDNYFIGYVGTQSDKTIDAIKIYDDLLKNMPKKDTRIDMIKNYLKLSTISNKPTFREIPDYILKNQIKGFDIDPREYKLGKYNDLTFDDIFSFYENNIKNSNICYIIVGDKKNIDTKELENFGKLFVLKEKELFSK